MKKILYFCIAVLCFVGTVNAQYCAGITVESFPLNPQSGVYNYFGIRVTLDQIYSENVSVHGYIFDEGGGPNQTHPFTVTVSAGTMIGETSSTFYETDPTSNAIVNVDVITPSQITSGSTVFNTGCGVVGITPENTNNAYDYSGQIHNAALDYFLSITPSLNSHSDVASNIYSFYQSKSWVYRADSFFLYAENSGLRTAILGASDRCTVYSTNGFSSEFCSFGNTLIGYLNDASADYSTIYSNIVYTEGQITNSTTLTSAEKQILLSAASVARYSGFYWGLYANITAWETYTGQLISKTNPKYIPEWSTSTYSIGLDNSLPNLTGEILMNTNDNFLVETEYTNNRFEGYNKSKNSLYSESKVNNYFDPKSSKLSTNIFFKWSWKNLGKVDLAGAIAGGVAGALMGGTASLGTLTVPAWVAGAVSWGVGSSVAGAFGMLTGWW